MTDIQGLPYFEVTYDAQGNGGLENGGSALLDAVAAKALTSTSETCDVFILAHGWNNSEASARALYQNMYRLLSGMVGAHLSSTIAVGVFWPARVLSADDPSVVTTPPAADVLSLGDAFPGRDLSTLSEAVAGAGESGDGGLIQQAQELAPQARRLGGIDEDEPLVRVKKPDLGTDLEHLVEHICGNSLDIVRAFSYWEMKSRAGVVGENGLGPLVRQLQQRAPRVRVHLIGHSFGARLVAHALVGLGDVASPDASPVKSVMFLQGAFSHFAFSPAITRAAQPGTAGPLAQFAARVGGPLLATFTSADRALGEWYPMATMVQHDDLALFDHPAYRWGAMGHDGFQQANAVTAVLAPQGSRYAFQAGTCYRLDANHVINADEDPFAGAHSDICHPEVLWAAASAAKLTT
jgi:hypothetical protein